MKLSRTQAGKQSWLRTFTTSHTVREVEAAFALLEELQGRDLSHLKAQTREAVDRLQAERGMTEEEAVKYFTNETAAQSLLAPLDGQHRRSL